MTQLHDEVRLPAGEYNRVQKLMSAYSLLACEAVEILERYGSVARLEGLKRALATVGQRRHEMSEDIAKRYGLEGD